MNLGEDIFNQTPVNYVMKTTPVVNSSAPIKTADLSGGSSDMYSLPFSLTYGEENGALLPTSGMTLDQFTKSITGVDLNYNYVNLDKGTSDSDFISDFLGYTGALGDKVTSGIGDFYNAVSDTVTQGASSVFNLASDTINSIWYKLLMFLAISLVAIWIIAKSGILKQAAAFV